MAKSKNSWLCPFCNHKTIVREGEGGDVKRFYHMFHGGVRHGAQYANLVMTVCPNDDCGEYSASLEIGQMITAKPGSIRAEESPEHFWQLIPNSAAKIFPPYIPQQLLDDYKEACLIVKLSPKASATLSRRCLQGMIRDFWKVTRRTLHDEIEAIQNQIDAGTREAIHAVRNVGNIGAHMEKDINVIVDVLPEEAEQLIGLIETLFEDGYIARHDHEERLLKLKALAAAKDQAKMQGQPKN